MRGRDTIWFIHGFPSFEKSDSRLYNKCQTIDWLGVYIAIKIVVLGRYNETCIQCIIYITYINSEK